MMARGILLLLACVLATSLIQEVGSVVYYVNPDGRKHHTGYHTLTYYQNHNKLSSSNTKLYFQPGSFYIKSLLVISNVTNLSFIGSKNGNTTIRCDSKAYPGGGILINNSKNIEIISITITQCAFNFEVQYIMRSKSVFSNLMVLECENIFIQTSTFIPSFEHIGISLLNPMGSVRLLQVNAGSLLVYVCNITINANITIEQFRHIKPYYSRYVISIILLDHSKSVDIHLSNTEILQHKAIAIDIVTCTSMNTINIDDLCLITDDWNESILKPSKIISVFLTANCKMALSNCGEVTTFVELNNCQFTNIIKIAHLIFIQTQQLSNVLCPLIVHIKNSSFYNTSKIRLIYSAMVEPNIRRPLLTLIVANSTFKEISAPYIIDTVETSVILQGPVYFAKINGTTSYLIRVSKGTIKIKSYTEFSFITSNVLIYTTYVEVAINTVVNFTSNTFKVGMAFPKSKGVLKYLLCAFHYTDTMNNHTLNQIYDSRKISIAFTKNSGKYLFSKKHSISHCDWIEQSIFLQSDPRKINEQIIKYSNNSLTGKFSDNKICTCTDERNYTCTANNLMPAYPGQRYSLKLIAKGVLSSTVSVRFDELPFTSCRTRNELMRVNIFQDKCTTLEYNIQFRNRRSCELYLRGTSSTFIDISESNPVRMQSDQDLLSIYHISMIPCPSGFMLNDTEGFCQCVPLVVNNVAFITDCNINDQTILRPANSWISAHTVNNYSTYDVSLECPFDYCIPHQSYINLVTPNLQCQFNRCGVLCGHCPPGYSAVFGSSQCKYCSNVYLLIIIPIAIAGIVLVFLLFLLNLTVTDGSITPFIYYVNIISINSAVFFPEHHRSLFTKFACAFVSIANLDLGIETCFYDGMTGYAKLLLQFAFPFYLISIAILLTLASRYSTRIQRLTARRALPVLATLFVLSYTKILQTVCTALFFYNTITHLPSKEATVMWSVDTNVPIFEAKFILLFTISLILFLILMVFNIVLVFTRSLSRFKLINRLKPLLDAYQGPYKDRFYFWTGLQLVTRAIFFGLSALDSNIDLVLASLFPCLIAVMHGQLHPYSRKDKNIQEVLFLFNLQVLFLIKAFTDTGSATVNILITVALLQFGFILLKQIKLNFLKDITIQLNLRKIFHYNIKQTQLQSIELTSIIPEKSIYHEFQEPLLQDI